MEQNEEPKNADQLEADAVNKDSTVDKNVITQPVTPKKSKKPIIITLVVAVIIVVSLLLIYLLIIKDNNNNQDISVVTTESSEAVVPQVSDYSLATAEYSVNTNGDFYALSLNDKNILDRSTYDWGFALRHKDWLYFMSLDHTSVDEYENAKSDVTYTLSAFNFNDNSYKKITELKSPISYASPGPIDLINDNEIAISFNGYREPGRTYSCKILAESSEPCMNWETLYDGSGTVYKVDSEYYLVDGWADAGHSTYTIYSLDPNSSKKSEIASGGISEGEGTEFLTINKRGEIWLSEYSSDVLENNGDGPNYTSKLKNVYAIDKNGKKTKTLPQLVKYSEFDYTETFSRYHTGDSNIIKISNYDTKKVFEYNTINDELIEYNFNEYINEFSLDRLISDLNIQDPYRLVLSKKEEI